MHLLIQNKIDTTTVQPVITPIAEVHDIVNDDNVKTDVIALCNEMKEMFSNKSISKFDVTSQVTQ